MELSAVHTNPDMLQCIIFLKGTNRSPNTKPGNSVHQTASSSKTALPEECCLFFGFDGIF